MNVINLNRSTPTLVALFAALTVAVSCSSADPAPATPTPPATNPDPPRPTASQPATTPSPVAATPASTDPDDASTLDGVYTSAQAARGRQVFENICSECHKTEEWMDQGFRDRWQDESVFGFWYYIYEQMPNGAPPYSLERQEVTDVLTYILELNGLPAGNAELGSDDDSIDKYWLRWGPSN